MIDSWRTCLRLLESLYCMPSSIIMTNSQWNRPCHENWSRPEEHCFTRQGSYDCRTGRSEKVSDSRLGLYHHLLVGQAGKSFIVGTLRVVLSGCGCVLRLRPSRFPFFLLFSTSPSRVALPSSPSFLLPPRLPSPVFCGLSFPLSSTFGCPAVAADLSCRVSPSPSARLPLPASNLPFLRPMPRCPNVLTVPPHFSSIFASPSC